MCVANRCDSSCLWYRHRWAWYVSWQWDNRWIFVLKTLFSLTGELPSTNICLEISNKEGWRSTGMNLLKGYCWTRVKGLTVSGALRSPVWVVGLYVNVWLILVQLGINTPPPKPHKDKLKDRLEGRGPTSRAGFTEGNDMNGSMLKCMWESPGGPL